MIIAYIQVTSLFYIFIFLINLSTLTVDIVVSFYIQLNHQPRERFLTKSFQVYFPLILVTRTRIKRTVCSSLSYHLKVFMMDFNCGHMSLLIIQAQQLSLFGTQLVDIILGSFILATVLYSSQTSSTAINYQ